MSLHAKATEFIRILEPNLRQNANPKQLEMLNSLQEKLAFAIEMGYIKTYDELIAEMIRIYRIRNNYFVL